MKLTRRLRSVNYALIKGTNKPCYLIEVCFVNDSVDVALYRKHFDAICQAIVSELAKAVGKTLKPSTTTSPAEDKEVRILDTSPSLSDTVKSILDNKAQRAHKSWLDKLNDRTITNDEILALAAMSIVNEKNKLKPVTTENPVVAGILFNKN
ncbi:hypothetical protein MKX73_16425 [Solibacillus sp. FSL W7-1436]|uniref:hypothetical protein n=1 Tax=Solibacillus sp. FSL W7-1436 TaxID=2921705 RepID=UPI0030F748E3